MFVFQFRSLMWDLMIEEVLYDIDPYYFKFQMTEKYC